MRINIKVRTNAPETKITKEENNLVYIDVHAKPENNQANIEIIKFFSRLYKQPVTIIAGLRSNKKVLEIG
mgnify:CR=1 FL=1